MIKKFSIFFLLLVLSFIAYAIIININSKNMTVRQKLLKAAYPVMMWFTKLSGTNTTSLGNGTAEPLVPLYTIPATLTNGSQLDLNQYKGKKILLVNTASDCGYTSQFDELEKLYRQHKASLVILAFPANDFKEQEKGADENIAAFCKINFGITFPLMKKSQVVKAPGKMKYLIGLATKIKMDGTRRHPPGIFVNIL